MTPEIAKYYLPYFQALADGKKVEYEKFVDKWEEWHGACLLNNELALRIIKEPEVIYCNKLNGFHRGSAEIRFSELGAIEAAAIFGRDKYEYIAKRFVAEE